MSTVFFTFSRSAAALGHKATCRGRTQSQTSAPARQTRRSAYTLVEVMIGMGLFAILAGSLFSLTWIVRSASEENVYNTIAQVMAQSYMEQLRGVAYPTLQQAANSTTVAIPLVNSSGTPVTDTAGNRITNGDANWAQETVYLDQSATGNPIQPMNFSFKVALTDLATVSPGPGNGSKPVSGIEAVVTFQCSYNFGIFRTYRGSLRSVISAVPTY
jgi:type II secretory pathway pseudopilin PulG